jgi:transcriptional regulator GlxA family with amidase domain
MTCLDAESGVVSGAVVGGWDGCITRPCDLGGVVVRVGCVDRQPVLDGVAPALRVPPLARPFHLRQHPVPEVAGPDPLGCAVAWAVEHLERPLTVDHLAERAGMSPRTFARRFRALHGTTPYHWLLARRLDLARRLLETTDEPVERVAERSGLGSAPTLRHHFRRSLAAAPLAYRLLFARTGDGTSPSFWP